MEKKGKERKCRVCGKTWYYNENKRLHYCNEECKKKYHDSHKKIKIHACRVCGKTWTSEESKRTVFCSEECAKKKIMANPKPKNLKGEALRKWIEQKVLALQSFLNCEGENEFDRIIDYSCVGDIPENVREKVLERDNYECQICKTPYNLHLHHLIPRKRGGKHETDNLITLCASCHRSIECGDSYTATLNCYKNASNTWYSVNDTKQIIENSIPYIQEVFDELNKNREENLELLTKLNIALNKLEHIN